MALRWLLLVCLVSFALGQTTMETDATNQTDAPPTDATTMQTEATTMQTEATTMQTEATTMQTEATTMPPPETTEMATEMATLPSVNLTLMDLNITQRYILGRAVTYRGMHFFCPDQGGDFVDDIPGVDEASRTINDWTIFLQYPVLAYLDSSKKTALINQIVALILLGAPGLPLDATNICIGRVYHYDVSLYTESVLINIYLRDSTVTIEQIQNGFAQGVQNAIMGNEIDLIQPFRGRNAIVISNDTYGRVNDNVHPGAFTPQGVRFDPSQDPTLRAVILGFWGRQYSLSDIMNTEALNNSIVFATNPNPVYYGLTGGDIVFIVIGTLLCSLLAFLMVFGFCIQPFFM